MSKYATTDDAKIKRKAIVIEMIAKGMTINQMARELDIAGQSVQKFLKLHGLKTHTMLKMEGSDAAPVDEKAAARKAARQAMPKIVVDRSGAVSDRK